MSLSRKVLGLVFGALLCATASCYFTEPGEGVNRSEGPIPGINVNVDGPDQVIKALGAPSSRASGWWKSTSPEPIHRCRRPPSRSPRGGTMSIPSAMARSGSGQNINPYALVTASNDSLWNCRSSPSR